MSMEIDQFCEIMEMIHTSSEKDLGFEIVKGQKYYFSDDQIKILVWYSGSIYSMCEIFGISVSMVFYRNRNVPFFYYKWKDLGNGNNLQYKNALNFVNNQSDFKPSLKFQQERIIFLAKA